MTKAEGTKPLKVLKLTAENVKRISAVEISPDPANPLVIIRGENGNGKSSVLDSIAYAIGGGRLQPPRVIRDGEDDARVELDLGDLVVERTWSKGGRGQLEVRNADGVPQKSPQALLDSLTGKFSFDPVAFLGLKATEQAEQVRVALGLDFTALDKEREERFADRTLVNREVDRFKARLTALPKPPADAPAPVDLQALIAEKNKLVAAQLERGDLQSKAREAATKRDALGQEGKTLKAAIEQMEGEIEALQQRIENAKLQRQGVEGRWKKAAADAKSAQVLAEHAPDVDLELADIDMKLSEADAASEAGHKAKEREQVAVELKKKEEEAEALTKRIDSIDTEKADMLAKTRFPVEGLEYTHSGLKFRGVPFEQASQAERLRVSVAMGLASNPKLRVLLVREASLLDSKSLALLASIAKEHEAQVFAEMVGTEGKGPCVVIVDGAVSEVRK